MKSSKITKLISQKMTISSRVKFRELLFFQLLAINLAKNGRLLFALQGARPEGYRDVHK